jgi:hypothetical protein
VSTTPSSCHVERGRCPSRNTPTRVAVLSRLKEFLSNPR